jgi:hypothetical protein
VVCSLPPGMFRGPRDLYVSRTGSSYHLLYTNPKIILQSCTLTLTGSHGRVTDGLCALDVCVCLVLAIFDDDNHDMFASPSGT